MAEIDESNSETSSLYPADSNIPSIVGEHRAQFASFWSAPLPRPEILAKYNEAFPGCAERIVAMAEQQGAHRQRIELQVINGNVYSQKVGLWLGFFLALIVISSGAWLVYDGRIAWGAGFIGIPLIGLVSIFVLGKRDQNRELSHKHPEQTSQQKLPFPE